MRALLVLDLMVYTAAAVDYALPGIQRTGTAVCMHTVSQNIGSLLSAVSVISKSVTAAAGSNC